MIIDGWVDWATRRDGPPEKVYAQENAREGLVLHSMEGWLLGSLAELDNPKRSASWKYSLSLEGVLFQHYPRSASEWASGNAVANTLYEALELEGRYTMPINAAQIFTLLRLVAELGYSREQLHEHREVWNMAEPNAGSTACPSERYAPFYAALEDDMADPRVDALIKAFGGQAAIDAWNADGNSLLMGYAGEQREQDSLEARVLAIETHGSASLPDHDHEGGTSGPVKR